LPKERESTDIACGREAGSSQSQTEGQQIESTASRDQIMTQSFRTFSSDQGSSTQPTKAMLWTTGTVVD